VKKLNHSEVARTRGGGHPDTLFNCWFKGTAQIIEKSKMLSSETHI
jgi:hypothetical protein